MSTRPLVIFGTGIVAEVITCEFLEQEVPIVAYVVDDEKYEFDYFLDKPVISISSLKTKYPPQNYDAFVAIGYHSLNRLRSSKVSELRELGYKLISCIPDENRSAYQTLVNTYISSDAVVQPKAEIGNNCFIWGGAIIGHHSKLGDNNWVSGGAIIGGCCTVGDSSFFGLGSIVSDSVRIGNNCLIGAKSFLSSCTKDDQVFLESQTESARLTVSQFLRISRLF
jgi:acetyltransferase-like isoleucine patch superfamily enzyme